MDHLCICKICWNRTGHETLEIAKIRNRDIQNSIHYDGVEMIKDSGHILGGRGLLFDDVFYTMYSRRAPGITGAKIPKCSIIMDALLVCL